MEWIREKWYCFRRFKCAQNTTIDIWSGDQADDPNKDKESNYQLNSFATYYRKNDGKWIHSSEIHRSAASFMMFASEFCELFTADEIWNETIRTNKR